MQMPRAGQKTHVRKQPAASSQQPAANSRQPAASSRQPAASSQQPASSRDTRSQQPAASSKQPRCNNNLPTIAFRSNFVVFQISSRSLAMCWVSVQWILSSVGIWAQTAQVGASPFASPTSRPKKGAAIGSGSITSTSSRSFDAAEARRSVLRGPIGEGDCVPSRVGRQDPCAHPGGGNVGGARCQANE